MAMILRDALEETTLGWKEAVPSPWRPVFNDVQLDAKAVPLWLKHQPWVPIFPVFKSQETGEIFQASPTPKQGTNLIGIPGAAHTFRALLVPPPSVKVVVVGQDPYPDITDATGQSFEQGSISDWVRDAHRVAGSLQAILQTAAAAVLGDERYRVQWRGWKALSDDIAANKVALTPPAKLFPAYQKQGVLWLNTTLTISHFRVYPRGKPDPKTKKPLGFQEAHAAYWKPFVSAVFQHVVSQGPDRPVVFALFGSWAKSFKSEIEDAARSAGNSAAVSYVLAGHPVTKPFIERTKNPLIEVNERLLELGGRAINWLPA